MGQAYTPGLKVAADLRHRTRRALPIPGEVVVEAGQTVKARDIVARAAMPGDVTPINLANMLGASPADVPRFTLVRAGQRIEPGDILARTAGVFGFFKSEAVSPVSGTVESISHVTGLMLVRHEPIAIEVAAFLPGTIKEVIPEQGVVIEARVTYIQGIFGVGGETYGEIAFCCDRPDQPLTAERIQDDMRGKVLIGGARMTADAVAKAREIGAAAIISGGIDDQDLRDILGYDLGVAVTGNEKLGLTIVITEGFGEIAMARRTFELLQGHVGDDASVSGVTQIRAGVLRPEIVIPTRRTEAAEDESNVSGELRIGLPVRLIRDPYFGRLGHVSSLPHELCELESGSKARVLAVKTDDGEELTVPRANVELIEE